VAAAGLDGIHLRGDPDRTDRQVISRLMAEAGVVVTGITPNLSWPRDGADPSNPDVDVRRRGVDYYRSLVDLGVEVRSPAVLFVPAAEGRTSPLEDPEREWEWARDSAMEVARYAEDRGVRVAVEPLNRYESYLVTRVDQALQFVREVGRQNVGIAVDSFHMNIEEHDPEACVRSAADLLMEIQLADSNRLGPGLGHLNLAGIVSAGREVGFSGPYILEFVAPHSSAFVPAEDDAAFEALTKGLMDGLELVGQQMDVTT
jgi:D-psicose/D-tagatose/L-ribulose 3-epimerase